MVRLDAWALSICGWAAGVFYTNVLCSFLHCMHGSVACSVAALRCMIKVE